MRLFDTHCHLGLLHSDRIEQLLAVQLAKRASVNHIISICNNLTDFEQVYSNLRSASNVFHAVGVSPTESKNKMDGWENKIQDLLKLNRVIAIGETGLDYDPEKSFAPKQTQVDLFIKHLEIANKAGLPVIIHNRKAGTDILNVLKNKIPPKGAVFHCFSENWDFAKSALDLPVYFSFAGNITRSDHKFLLESVKNLPADRILIESEAPFMTPAKYYKGKNGKRRRNKPEYLIETAQKIADVRETDLEEMAEILYQNSLRAFHLPAEE